MHKGADLCRYFVSNRGAPTPEIIIVGEAGLMFHLLAKGEEEGKAHPKIIMLPCWGLFLSLTSGLKRRVGKNTNLDSYY